MAASPAPGETLGSLISTIVSFFSNRNMHKLAGTAVAALGLVSVNKLEAIVGAAYAAAMHITGGLKNVPE